MKNIVNECVDSKDIFHNNYRDIRMFLFQLLEKWNLSLKINPIKLACKVRFAPHLYTMKMPYL